MEEEEQGIGIVGWGVGGWNMTMKGLSEGNFYRLKKVVFIEFGILGFNIKKRFPDQKVNQYFSLFFNYFFTDF